MAPRTPSILFLTMALGAMTQVGCSMGGPPAAGRADSAILQRVEGNARMDSMSSMLGFVPNQDSTVEPPEESAAPDAQEPPASSTRKMIVSGQMAIQVAHVRETLAKLQQRVEALGGYISNRRDATLVCRIPAGRFSELVDEVREWGRVLSESLQAQDVTEQHMDITIRLENAQRSRERLLALLDKAVEVDDVLKIEEQLRRLTVEIEGLEAKLASLNDRIALSTLTVRIEPVATQSHTRRYSRFHWINAVGAENVLSNF